jgi:two-component system, NarL family, response regulator LiaR
MTASTEDRGQVDHATDGSAPLRVIVADDDPFARRVIKDALQRAGVVVIAEASNGREAAELALFYTPDVVLMDVVMPELDGIAATRRIVKARPQQKVVIVTGSGDDEMAYVGLQAGAAGFITKDVDVEAIPRAVKGAAAGEAAISRQLAMGLIERLRSAPRSTAGAGMRPVRSILTAREWEVLDHLTRNHTTDQIAESLVLSGETVRSHVKSIFRKLGVSSRAAAVEKAAELRAAESAGNE